MPNISFDAPPTVARFMESEAFFRLIAGPVGSGKTTGCIFELLRRAIQQAPGKDGVRRTRFAIVRQTLKQLKDTVLKDILEWLDGIAAYKVSDNTIYISFDDVYSEWLLIPLEDQEDQRRLLSSQLTGAWMSEAIEINPELIPPLLGRCGRYPSKGAKPDGHTGDWPSWHGVIADTNFPTEGSSWHLLMEVNTPPDWSIFKQPGGLSKQAENIDNLPGGYKYYERLSRGNSDEWVNRYVHAQYGADPSGAAVFRSSFKRSFHVTPKTEILPGIPLVLAQDLGRFPCGLIGQVDPRGRVIVHKELVSEDMGLDLHIRRSVRPALMSEPFIGMNVYVVADPAGNQRSTLYELNDFDLFKQHGFRAFPAPTNNINRRIQAVEGMLLSQYDGRAGLLISEEGCPQLIQAMNGMYRYQRRRSGELNPNPEKSRPWSDLADALQYMCLVAHGGMSSYIVNNLSEDVIPPAPPMPVSAWT